MALRFRLARFGGPTTNVLSGEHTWQSRDGILLGLFAGERLLGLGEASPLPGTSPDDAERAAGALAALPELESLPACQTDARAWACALKLSSPSACFAVETALLDAIARREGIAFGDLLGSRRGIARCVLLGRLDDTDLVERGRHAAERGARVVKIKARGLEPQREASLLVELRRVLGAEICVRLDLNGSLSVPQAQEALRSYAHAEVELVEEPCAGEELLELGAVALPIFADESLVDRKLARRLLAAPNIAGVVLKPTVLGGVSRCVELAHEARTAGKRVIVTHAFEGAVAVATACELALALTRQGDPAPGLDEHSALNALCLAAATSAVPQLAARAGGTLGVVPAPVSGHGVSIRSAPWQS